MRQRLVIIGAGMAANRLLGELAQRCPGDYEVALLGAEPHQPYSRILLSPLLSGEKQPEELALDEWRGMPETRLHLGDAVRGVDRDTRVVLTASGARFPYDKLVLAVGSDPIRPPLPGHDLPGVFTFRDRGDTDRLIAASATSRRAVVIGGGLLGLEAACGLARRGLDVTVVHLMGWLMERQLDAAAAAMLRGAIEARGVNVALNGETEALLGSDGVSGVRLKGGRVLPADLVIFAIGIRPNVALGRSMGVAVGRGVVVDDAMRTSDPNIFAIGECAEHRGVAYGLVAPLWEQAAVAASQLAGDAGSFYVGSMVSTSLKVSGVELFSAGHVHSDAASEEIVCADAQAGLYRKLLIKDGRLAGVVLLGDARDGKWYAELIRDKVDLRSLRGDLVFGRDFVDLAEAA